MAFYFKKITVIGVGLIGGSLSIIFEERSRRRHYRRRQGLANLEAAKGSA